MDEGAPPAPAPGSKLEKVQVHPGVLLCYAHPLEDSIL